VLLTEETLVNTTLAELGYAPVDQPGAPSFTEFKRAVWASYEQRRHLDLIDAHLEQVADFLLSNGQRGIDRLMIFTPPQYGKSTTVSQLFRPGCWAATPTCA